MKKRGRPRKLEKERDEEPSAGAGAAMPNTTFAYKKGTRTSSRLDRSRQTEAGAAVSDYIRERQDQMKQRRIDALLEDNFFGVEGANEDDDEDVNFEPDAGGEDGEEPALEPGFLRTAKKPKKKKSLTLKQKMSSNKPYMFKKSLKAVLETENAALASGTVGFVYATAELPDSRLPKRRFCCVCGQSGIYRCRRCDNAFCSMRCDESHRELKCNKFTA